MDKRNDYSKESTRLLVISSNAFSTTGNNGKTLYSFIDALPKECVRQLYFRTEMPSVKGYNYYSLSDKAVLNHLFHKNSESIGVELKPEDLSLEIKASQNAHKVGIKRNNITCIIRECVWKNNWQSKALIEWLDEYNPTSIFFLGGDTCFTYDICLFIRNRYNAKLFLYITDEYLLERNNETFLFRLRRKHLLGRFKECLAQTTELFTVSEAMRLLYKKEFGVDSFVISNLSESIYSDENSEDAGSLYFIYAGSLYYGRDKVLGYISKALDRYNKENNTKHYIRVFSNETPNRNVLELFEIQDVCSFLGSLEKNELIAELRKSNILLYVESFDDEQVQKTKYAQSTKIPEYLSLKKPIFAVGSPDNNSIMYLHDVAVLATNENEIFDRLSALLDNRGLKDKVANAAYNKFIVNHDKNNIQSLLYKKIL